MTGDWQPETKGTEEGWNILPLFGLLPLCFFCFFYQANWSETETLVHTKDTSKHLQQTDEHLTMLSAKFSGCSRTSTYLSFLSLDTLMWILLYTPMCAGCTVHPVLTEHLGECMYLFRAHIFGCVCVVQQAEASGLVNPVRDRLQVERYK